MPCAITGTARSRRAARQSSSISGIFGWLLVTLQLLTSGKGEFAKFTAINESMYHYDKTKAVLAAKCHLNEFRSCTNDATTRNRQGVYVLQNVYQMSYPRTSREIRNKAIQNLVNGLALIEVCGLREFPTI
ncbi:uncharacterized protein BYT42DRAFT_62757 [Radiomyces spectabilis]|uniref:uncharacterized protein n=1 Tax=Radiomyces spectabilis TaxID=64574 RepID=UPI002220A65C|nr:uncharacterized protein BYT42DRAFT_62757 [Radiomyces spectabilis]KAI8373226.1 hypothetical protein BYT42DRAFT_62757 [Radiomyces spectabilis]